jgi:ribosomal protein S12 methylthiotransferase
MTMTDEQAAFVTLGCPKNQVDSEIMAGRLAEAGFRLTADLSKAGIIIVNTCGFIEKAREESIETILALARYKKEGACRLLVAVGCLVQRHLKELRQAMSEIDLFVTLDDMDRLADILRGRAEPSGAAGHKPVYLYDGKGPRFMEDGQVSAYLKISEGCDHRCAYCTIPLIRGDLRSRPLPFLVREAGLLADRGVRELNVIAHDCTAYGMDLGLDNGLVRLLEALLKLDRLHWIRLLYLYPYTVPPALLTLMQDEKRLCPYLDVPLQHSNRDILTRMGRDGDLRSVVSMIDRARRDVAGMTVRTTFIVGFPGETRARFRELVRFCEDMAFDRMGVFIYSPENGTKAADLEGRVGKKEKQARFEELMALQQRISEKKNRALVGKTVEVLLEGFHPDTEYLLRGRTAAMAPEVDGDVIINEGDGRFGEFFRVEVTEAHPYDLVGRIRHETES